MKFGVDNLCVGLTKIGVTNGDVILVRADIGKIGRLKNGAESLIDALLECVGADGTIISLAYTPSYITTNIAVTPSFHVNEKSYAGALPNAMLRYSDSHRSTHPTNSIVSIGKLAQEFTKNHTPTTPAYEPIRSLIRHGGACLVIGCVDNSPGFTTTHLAEYDTGRYKRIILPKLNRKRYIDEHGIEKVFARPDLGMCSQSFNKFYSHYVSEGILSTGQIGLAYSILAKAADTYLVDCNILRKEPMFNICDSSECVICNMRRWDRVYRAPVFLTRVLFKAMVKQWRK